MTVSQGWGQGNVQTRSRADGRPHRIGRAAVMGYGWQGVQTCSPACSTWHRTGRASTCGRQMHLSTWQGPQVKDALCIVLRGDGAHAGHFNIVACCWHHTKDCKPLFD